MGACAGKNDKANKAPVYIANIDPPKAIAPTPTTEPVSSDPREPVIRQLNTREIERGDGMLIDQTPSLQDDDGDLADEFIICDSTTWHRHKWLLSAGKLSNEDIDQKISIYIYRRQNMMFFFLNWNDSRMYLFMFSGLFSYACVEINYIPRLPIYERFAITILLLSTWQRSTHVCKTNIKINKNDMMWNLK